MRVRMLCASSREEIREKGSVHYVELHALRGTIKESGEDDLEWWFSTNKDEVSLVTQSGVFAHQFQPGTEYVLDFQRVTSFVGSPS